MSGSAWLGDARGRLEAWIVREGFRGWDPFDALNSPLLRRMALGQRRLGQAYVQLLKRSPINLRPWLRVAKGYNPKGMGLFLAAYCRKFQSTESRDDAARIAFLRDWLVEHHARGYRGMCWGYNFDWPNRGFFARAGTPTIVNTAFIGLGFLDLVRTPLAGVDGDPPALEVARSAGEFVRRDLWSTTPAPDELAFSYTPIDRRVVHNASVLGAWLLAEVAAATGAAEPADVALAAARYTARRQRSDGSWLYGEEAKDHWVDSFHTGFVLVGLRRIGEVLATAEFDDAVAAGYEYWKRAFFGPSGEPRYYPNADFPLDTHSAAQAILTYLAMREIDREAPSLAARTARWAIATMQDPDGFFYYQIHRRYTNRIPYMRWSQAWMFRALVELEGHANAAD